MVQMKRLTTSRRAVVAAGITSLVAPSLSRSVGAQETMPSWQLLSSGDGPAVRWDHSLSYDEENKRLIVFGGRGADYGALGDTWSYDLQTGQWQQIEAAGPSPRFGHAVAMLPDPARLVLFGGQSADSFFNDTWVFDFATSSWSAIDTGDQALPAPRYGLPAISSSGNTLIISHGFTFEGRFDDTWSLDLADGTWSNLTPAAGEARPLNRCLHEAVWDRDQARMVLYGGCSSGFGPCPQGDLWAFDPESRVWTELTPAEGPAARSNPAMFFDRTGQRALLFGGLTDAGYAADLWAGSFDGEAFSWSAIQTEGVLPAPRASHDFVLARGDGYLFGGTGDGGALADLWKLSLR